MNPATLISRGNVNCCLFITRSVKLLWSVPWRKGNARLVLQPQLPVMEVWWNVKLPVNVCARYTDAVPPPQQSRMGGGPSFLCKTSDSSLLQRERERERRVKRWIRRVFLRRVTVAETKCGGDWGRQLYCSGLPAVWWMRVCGQRKLAERGVVVVPRWSWNFEYFLTPVSHNYYWHLFPLASSCCSMIIVNTDSKDER